MSYLDSLCNKWNNLTDKSKSEILALKEHEDGDVCIICQLMKYSGFYSHQHNEEEEEGADNDHNK
jgi:hypothetical protein